MNGLLSLFLACVAFALPGTAQTVELVTSDIDNFWKVQESSEPGNRRAAIQFHYFDRASPGLADFDPAAADQRRKSGECRGAVPEVLRNHSRRDSAGGLPKRRCSNFYAGSLSAAFHRTAQPVDAVRAFGAEI